MSRSKVLLADDQRLERSVVEGWLQEWGYDVISVEDGERALTALTNDPDICLAVVDWVMPKLTGPDLCRRLRRLREEPYVHVILLTGRSQVEALVEGFEAGADDYIIKPFNPVELRLRLRAAKRVVDLQRELVEHREQARREARIDSLTGVWNRPAILKRLEDEVARASRNGTHVSVVAVDLDHFKAINDKFGHPGGDAVLKEAVGRMKVAGRVYDALGRIGGEEFLYVAPDCDLRGARLIAERMRLRLRVAPVMYRGQTIPITGSFGVASLEQHRQGAPEDLVMAADLALYRAKQKSRDVVVEAEPSDFS